jgi:hypothetical protein
MGEHPSSDTMPSIPDLSSRGHSSDPEADGDPIANEDVSTAGRGAFALGERVLGEMKRTLLGERADVSVLICGVAVVLAAAVAAGIATTVGYPPIETWTVETWTGRNPHWQVFAGVGALVALAAVSGALNSGAVPSTLLAAGPLFGVGLTRYGTAVTREYVGTTVVSLPEAVVFGVFLAVFAGLPIGVLGFTVGHLTRWAAGVVAGRPSHE